MFHHIRPLAQFKPARAKKKIDDPAQLPGVQCWDEDKKDGERFVIHTDVGGPFPHACTSRRESTVTHRFNEKTDRVPHLMNLKNLPPKSLLDCEFISTADEIRVELPGKFWDKLMDKNHPHMKWFMNEYQGTNPVYPHVRETASIMGSLGPEAVRKQEENNSWIRAYCFDIVQYMGQDTRRNTQLMRRNFLAKQLEAVEPGQILLMPAWWNLTNGEVEELFYLLTDAEGEGLIRKDPSKAYDAANNWYKLKRYWPVDCVITGDYKVGEYGKTGKMDGKVSSIAVGVYDAKGVLQHVGWMSAIMDGEDNLMTPEEFEASSLPMSPVECLHNGLQVKAEAPLGHTLRHPRFRRHRNDKSAKDCTFAALQAEIKKGMS